MPRSFDRGSFDLISEAENRVADEAEQVQADAEAGTLAESFCKLDAGVDENDGEDNAENREQADVFLQRDLADIIDVQNGDQAVPSRNTCFHKGLPHADDGNHAQDQRDDARDRTRALISIGCGSAFHIVPPN